MMVVCGNLNMGAGPAFGEAREASNATRAPTSAYTLSGDDKQLFCSPEHHLARVRL